MEESKLTVTQEKREETIDKILELIETEFEGVEVTALFTKVLLEDAIKVLEDRVILTPINTINHILNTK